MSLRFNSVMTSFNEVNGIPATGDRWLLTDVLRKRWGFKGFVVTDYNSINEMINHGVAANTYQAGELAMNAGVDMDMQGQDYVHQLPKLVQDKKISMLQIDQAVRRVLEAKYKLGLFKDPYHDISESRAKREIMNTAHLKAAEDIASKSIVLLKNDHQLLPLSRKGTLAVIGPLADDQRDMIGAWSGAGDWQQSVSILQGIKNKAGSQVEILYSKGANISDDSNLLRQLNANGGDITPDPKNPGELIKDAVATARKADIVILCLGESEGMSGEAASRSDIGIPKNQRRLMKAVAATGKPVVLILSNGRPLILNWANQHVPAILETWFLGTEAGNAIGDVLFGDDNPSGKLTISFPVSVGQIPVYYDHKNTGRPMDSLIKYTSKYLDIPDDPLFPFGFGLSYTHFTYGPIALNRKVMHPADQLTASVVVTNTGNFDGTETVQLYLRQMTADITQPVEELKGFQQIFLKKGASQEVVFHLGIDDMKLLDQHMHWTYEPSAMKIMIGGNSRDVEKADFQLVR